MLIWVKCQSSEGTFYVFYLRGVKCQSSKETFCASMIQPTWHAYPYFGGASTCIYNQRRNNSPGKILNWACFAILASIRLWAGNGAMAARTPRFFSQRIWIADNGPGPQKRPVYAM